MRLARLLGRLPWWVQVAVELRHANWHADEVFELLERQGAAYCVMSGAGLLVPLPYGTLSTRPTMKYCASCS